MSTRPAAGSPNLRVAVVQFCPIADVETNIQRVEAVTTKLQPGTLDLVCLPEMCFTGYVFPTLSRLQPLLESPTSGPTSAFCTRLAQRLDCHVIAGYPELPDEHSAEGKMAYNSAMVYGPTGTLVHNYRKHNLFTMDLPWATPGPGFTVLPNPIAGLKAAVAICNDLNPPAELGEWCVAQDVRLLVVLCAWLSSEQSKSIEGGTQTDVEELEEGTEELEREGVQGEVVDELESGLGEKEKEKGRENKAWDRQNVAYWLYRLSDMLLDDDKTERYVVICNRTGTEHGSTFAGSSTLWKFKGMGDFETIGRLPARIDGVGIWAV